MRRTPRLRLLALALLLAGARLSTAQDVEPAAAIVLRALETGDAERLLSSTPARLEIALFGATRRYSRPQALFVLRDFFREYPPVRVEPQAATATGAGWMGSFGYTVERGARPLVVGVQMRFLFDQWQVTRVIIREVR